MTTRLTSRRSAVLLAVTAAGLVACAAGDTITRAAAKPADPSPVIEPAAPARAGAPEQPPAPPAAARPAAPPSAPATRSTENAVPAQNLPEVQEYPVPAGTRPHDVAPAPDGGVWYTAQGSGELGWLDPATGESKLIPLGRGSAPHGVIVGPDGAPWVTDGGLNAIVRVDPLTDEVRVFPLPASHPNANLNTAAFDQAGALWFTGQRGVYGRVDPATGRVDAWSAPRGAGPYGITTTPSGQVFYASLAGSHIAQIDVETAEVTVIEPPTPRQGARRVWSDSHGRIWVSEWISGQVSVYNPVNGEWREWKLPGANRPQTYSVYVDDRDLVWLTDFGNNAIVRFDPATEQFEQFPLPSPNGAVRQMLGRPGEAWGAESGASKLIVIRR